MMCPGLCWSRGPAAPIGAAIVLWLALSPLLAAPSRPRRSVPPRRAVPRWPPRRTRRSPERRSSGSPAPTAARASGPTNSTYGTSKPAASPAANPSGSADPRVAGAALGDVAERPRCDAVPRRARRPSATPSDEGGSTLSSASCAQSSASRACRRRSSSRMARSGRAPRARRCRGRRPVTPETPFAVGSISKTFTAALVVALAGEGRVDLDASVLTYLPTLKVDAGITVRDLSTHERAE